MMLRSMRLVAACLLLACGSAQAQQWWPGFIDTKGKAFLELPGGTKLCATAREALRHAKLEAGGVIALPLKVEALLPRGARLVFGVADFAGVASERVLTRIVAIERGTDKGACAHLAEPGADAPGYKAEEDRLAFGVHPPRPLKFRTPAQEWKSFGEAGGGATGGAMIDARFAAASDTPPAWRARVAPLLPGFTDVFGQPFEAVLEPGGAAQPLSLIGALVSAGAGATYSTLNLIVRGASLAAAAAARDSESQPPLFQSGPSGGIERNRAQSYVGQVAGMVDLDGDGVDEVVLRARYFSGGNLKILKFSGGKFGLARETAYEGE